MDRTAKVTGDRLDRHRGRNVGDDVATTRALQNELDRNGERQLLAEELEREGFIDTVGGKGTYVAAQNTEFLREKRMKLVEDKLCQAVAEARLAGLDLGELTEMLEILFKDNEP